MTRFMVEPDAERLAQPGLILQVQDPCCGTGGMLSMRRRASGHQPQSHRPDFWSGIESQDLRHCEIRHDDFR